MLYLPKTFLPLVLLTLPTRSRSGSQHPNRQTFLLNRHILDSLTQRIEYSRLLHRLRNRSDRLTITHWTRLQLSRGDVLRIDSPRVTIPPPLMSGSVVVPTRGDSHPDTSIERT